MSNEEQKAAMVVNDVTTISEGVIGTAITLSKIVKTYGYDPTYFKALKKYKLTGTRFWVFYKDVCEQEHAPMVAVIDACARGKVPKDEFIEQVDNVMEDRRSEVTCRLLHKTYVVPAVLNALARADAEVPAPPTL